MPLAPDGRGRAARSARSTCWWSARARPGFGGARGPARRRQGAGARRTAAVRRPVLQAAGAVAPGRPRQPDRQFARRPGAEREVLAAGVTIAQGAQVWAAFSPREVSALIDGRATHIRCRQLVIAPGAYERPVPFPGWTLPGVMTTGAAQTLARAYRVAPGRRVVIAGNGPLNLQLAAELLAGGAEVVAVLESAAALPCATGGSCWRPRAPRPTCCARAGATCAKLRAHKRAAAVGPRGGRGRRRGRTARRAGRSSSIRRAMPRPPRALRFEADTLCLGYGFIPSTELARMLGCEHRVGRPAPRLPRDRHRRGRRAPACPASSWSATAPTWAARAWPWRAARWPARRRRATLGLLAVRSVQGAGPVAPGRMLPAGAVVALRGAARRAGRGQRRHAAVPLRRDQLRLGARADPRRPRHAGGAQAQHAARHGALPGPLLRGHGGQAGQRDDGPAARGRAVLRAAPAGQAGAGRRARLREARMGRPQAGDHAEPRAARCEHAPFGRSAPTCW